MKFAYKVVRVQEDGRFTSLLASPSGQCFVEYKRGQIVRPFGGKFFVYSQKPTRKQIERITTDNNVRVFKCVVDELVEAKGILKGWDGNANNSWRDFWAGALDYTTVTKPLEDTHFCNEVMLLNDVTRSVSRG
jgi:hypothetical protein